MATRLAPGTLQPAEWVRARTGLHRAVYYPALVIAVLWAVVFVWAAVGGLWLVALLAACVMCVLVPALVLWARLRRRTSEVLLTDQRLIALQGPFPRQMSSLPLTVIDQVHVREARRFFGFRLGAGATLYAIPFRDAGVSPLEMHDLVDAHAFVQKVTSALAGR